MATLCLECGGTGGKKDLVFCADCNKFSMHRYCFPDYPKTKLGKVHWVCGCFFEPPDSDPVSEQIDSDFIVEEDDDSSDDDKPVTNQNQKLVRQRIPAMKSFTGYGNVLGPEKPVEPLIRSVWSGSFVVKFMNDELVHRSIDGFSAFLSNKASRMAEEEALRFGPVMHLEMVPKYLVWPKRFEEEGPSGDDIDLYFFPCLRQDGHRVYDSLVYEMGRDDVAMRMVMGNVELMIFTSVELPAKLRRFQSTLYLWGMVKEKAVEHFYGFLMR